VRTRAYSKESITCPLTQTQCRVGDSRYDVSVRQSKEPSQYVDMSLKKLIVNERGDSQYAEPNLVGEEKGESQYAEPNLVGDEEEGFAYVYPSEVPAIDSPYALATYGDHQSKPHQETTPAIDSPYAVVNTPYDVVDSPYEDTSPTTYVTRNKPKRSLSRTLSRNDDHNNELPDPNQETSL
jgi:hypothetical protein